MGIIRKRVLVLLALIFVVVAFSVPAAAKVEVAHTSEGWCSVEDGTVNHNFTGLAPNAAGWWYLENGKVNFHYNGTVRNSAGLWVVQGGKVNFSVNGVQYINVNGQNGWWNVENGRVAENKSVVAHNNAGWWYCPNGKVDFNYYGVAPNAAGWWRIEGGKVNFNFNGLAQNVAGRWVISGGKVDFGFTGIYQSSFGAFNIQGGKVSSPAQQASTKQAAAPKQTASAAASKDYADPTGAYAALNAFRTQKGVWYWNADNRTRKVFNTNSSNKLSPAIRDTSLEATARVRAREIATQFSHYRPNGTLCFTAYPDTFWTCAENICSGFSLDAADATALWQEEDSGYSGQGHRRNMLAEGTVYVGIACYQQDGMVYWVQCFGGM